MFTLTTKILRAGCKAGRWLPVALALMVAALPASAQVAPKIPLDKLQAMFANMRAQTHWNIDRPMLWGYFFLDDDRTKLDAATSELAGGGYRIVAIEPVRGRQDFRLHVEKVETHSPQSLYDRDIELEAIARKYKIRSYDGMDVGPAPTVGTAASATGP